MNPSKLKILTIQEAKILRKKWKSDGLKLVFTNGCFDILHLGHIDYLEKASLFGDRLIVGVNSDDSVSRLKGKHRPVNDEIARTRLLAALQFVDVVVVFEEDTPAKIIEILMPDILVKGKDYETRNIVGADFVIDHGGRVETIDMVKNYSTSFLINKIKTNL